VFLNSDCDKMHGVFRIKIIVIPLALSATEAIRNKLNQSLTNLNLPPRTVLGPESSCAKQLFHREKIPQ
jgi:hypothetical protein